MREAIRFNGKINSCTISQSGDKFYASFSIQIDKNEYMIKHKNSKRTNLALGIDIGLKSFLGLSNGLQINAPKPLNKLNRSIIKRARQLSKKLHPKTKGEVLQGVKKSNNYQKASINLNKLHRKISNIRSDFLHKLTFSLVANIDYFCLEDLNVKGMMSNHRLAKSISDVSFCEFKRMLEYKSVCNDKQIYQVDRFYPSSKICSGCGNIKDNLTLKDRVYICNQCGLTTNRDYNASLNLLSKLK